MGRVRRIRPRYHDEPNPGAQLRLLGSHDVSEPPPDPISHNGGPNMFGRNESGPKEFFFLNVCGAKN
jgi:hypothetical protein